MSKMDVGGASVMNVKVEMQAPRLHYVHPTCFEAGKPMEFIACGTNLLQRKFRYLYFTNSVYCIIYIISVVMF